MLNGTNDTNAKTRSKMVHASCYQQVRGRPPKGDRSCYTDGKVCFHCKQPIARDTKIGWFRDNENGVRHGTRKDPPANGAPVTFPEDADDAPASAPAPVNTAPLSPIAAAILAEISPHVRAEMDPARIASIASEVCENERATTMRAVAELIANVTPAANVTIVQTYDPIPTSEGPNAPEHMGPMHRDFPKLVEHAHAALRAGRGLWVYGGAGWGKTFHVHALSKALGLTWRMQGAIADRYTDLLGYIRPTDGVYVRTPWRDSVEHGGLHCFDELDASTDPGTPLAINASLANDFAPFPDGLVRRSPSCLPIGCGNTDGLGATADYNGRIRFDGAFLDRWRMFRWTEDEGLEKALYGEAAERVQRIRKATRELGIKVILSMRASKDLAACLSLGMPRAEAERTCVGGLMKDDQWSAVIARADQWSAVIARAGQ